MFYARDASGVQINISDALSNPHGKYFCPSCGGELIVKNGDKNVAHFAHKSLSDCDTFSHDMSEWHRSWQAQFAREECEVPISLYVDELVYIEAAERYGFVYDQYKTEKRKQFLMVQQQMYGHHGQFLLLKHRADVCVDKTVIEFQHSPMSYKEFNERTWFYTAAGYKLIWIFDFCEQVANENMYWDGDDPDKEGKWVWKKPFNTFAGFDPTKFKDNVLLFFQVQPTNFMNDKVDSYLEKIVWAIKGDSGLMNYRRFISINNPKTLFEIRKGIRTDTLFPVVLKCPKCGSMLVQGDKSLYCSNWKNGCKFTVWNKIAGHVLSNKEKSDLIRYKQTQLIDDFRTKQGQIFRSRLILDSENNVIFGSK